jgi:uncharacterized protein YqgV (UPF0045/DUF77 family)
LEEAVKSALAIQCLPLSAADKQEAYRLVDGAIHVIESSGLPFTVGPFETVVEGDAEALFELAKKAHMALIHDGSPRVATYMKVFSGPDLGSTEEKVGKYRERGH